MVDVKSGTRSPIPTRVVIYGVDADGTVQAIKTDGTGIKSFQDASTWSITVTADNVAATATKAAEVGKSHYITSVSASYSAAAIGLLTTKDGVATIGNYHAHNQRDVTPTRPLKITEGASFEAALAASGSVGVIGAVTATGYTV